MGRGGLVKSATLKAAYSRANWWPGPASISRSRSAVGLLRPKPEVVQVLLPVKSRSTWVGLSAVSSELSPFPFLLDRSWVRRLGVQEGLVPQASLCPWPLVVSPVTKKGPADAPGLQQCGGQVVLIAGFLSGDDGRCITASKRDVASDAASGRGPGIDGLAQGGFRLRSTFPQSACRWKLLRCMRIWDSLSDLPVDRCLGIGMCRSQHGLRLIRQFAVLGVGRCCRRLVL